MNVIAIATAIDHLAIRTRETAAFPLVTSPKFASCGELATFEASRG